ncbi:fructose-bisphosphatase class III [Psychromonas sp. KJ10-10]|uniref:fructose-bisphosphatase class III n=1 Tax=Psychromonas sp. KJ10-10 TaxID=3391823 RepID=UPI0039B4B84C
MVKTKWLPLKDISPITAALKKENKNAYYKFRDNEEVCINILKEFGLDESGHIINGHGSRCC